MKLLKALVASVVVLMAVLLLIHFYFAPLPRPIAEPVPNPNGYLDLVAAGQMLQGAVPDLKTATVEQLRGFVTTNQAALQRARSGLEKSCRVPLEYSIGFIEHLAEELASTKRLAMAFSIEGRLSELEHHTSDATSSYLTMMKLGVEMTRGGVLINSLVGVACETLGANRLDSLIPNLDAQQSHKLIVDLEKLDSSREPFEKMLERETLFFRVIATSWQRFALELSNLISGSNPQKATLLKAENKYHAARYHVLKLEVSAATHAFQLETGREAKGWLDLVPAYLKEIPKDPDSGQPMTYPL